MVVRILAFITLVGIWQLCFLSIIIENNITFSLDIGSVRVFKAAQYVGKITDSPESLSFLYMYKLDSKKDWGAGIWILDMP